MINKNDFPSVPKCEFWEGGYDEDQLSRSFEFAPSWIPEEYKSFFLSYYGYSIGGIETFTPGPAMVYENELRSRYEEFRAEYPHADDFFPIAYLNEDEWSVIHRRTDGSVEFGNFDVKDMQWFGGAPYSSFSDFTYSLTRYL